MFVRRSLHHCSASVRLSSVEEGKQKRESEAYRSENLIGREKDSCPVSLMYVFKRPAGRRHLSVAFCPTWIFKTVLEEKQARAALPRGQNQIETVENA